MSIKFASITPHPPIIIPTIGSSSDLEQVSETIKAMKKLVKIFVYIITFISSYTITLILNMMFIKLMNHR